MSKLPGCPNPVFPRLRKAIFVHGCFWRRHDCPYGRPFPATRPEFWRAKFAATVERDRVVLDELQQFGWDTLILWDCGTRTADALLDRLREFLAGWYKPRPRREYSPVAGWNPPSLGYGEPARLPRWDAVNVKLPRPGDAKHV